MEDKIEVKTNRGSISCYLYKAGNAIRPGIILLPDIAGVNVSIKGVAKSLAAENYHVILPVLYSQDGAARYCMRMMFNATARKTSYESDFILDIHSVIDYFKSLPFVLNDKLGVIGICLTGGFALHMAMRDDVKAPVVFHHSFGIEGAGVPKSCLDQIKGKVQGHFLENDPICPKTRVQALKEDLGDRLEVNMYKYVPHAIPHVFKVLPEGKTAWRNTLRFFDEQLNGSNS